MTAPEEEALGLWLRDSHGLSGCVLAEIRTGGDGNRTVRVTAGDALYVARTYGEAARRDPDWIRYELELLEHLHRGGISVARPVRSLGGFLATPLPGESGAPTALFTFAAGGVEWPTAPPRARALGASFARLHRIADDFRSPAAPRRFDAERLIDGPLTRMRPWLNETDPADRDAWETLLRVGGDVKARLEAIPSEGGAIGPIHGDLHQGNCHFEVAAAPGDDRLTFFDFSNAGIGWRVYDLSGFLWPLRDDAIEAPAVRACCDAFFEGYRSVRPLLPAEERAIGASVKARDYWETGAWLETLPDDPAVVRRGLRSLAEQFRRFPMR